MARKTKEDSQKTRDLILNGAEYVFYEKGLEQATMADIANKAGISRGAVYGHYKNTADVCVAMLNRAFSDAIQHIRIPQNTSPLENLRNMTLRFIHYSFDSSAIKFLVQSLHTNSDMCNDVVKRISVWDRIHHLCTKKMLKAAMACGELPSNLDIEIANTYWQAANDGILVSIVTYDASVVDLNKVGRMLIAVIDSLKYSKSLRCD